MSQVTIAMPRMSADPELTTAQSKYVESLARAGAAVHWVELTDPAHAVHEALACDGLLLPGGGDIDPVYFGQEPDPACGKPNPVSDTGRRQAGVCGLPRHPDAECGAWREYLPGHCPF